MTLGQRLFPGGSDGQDGQESACNVGDSGSVSKLGRFPWRREWLPTPVFLPREFHRQRNLVGFSPRGHKEWDTTEQLTCSLSLRVRADILEATE